MTTQIWKMFEGLTCQLRSANQSNSSFSASAYEVVYTGKAPNLERLQISIMVEKLYNDKKMLYNIWTLCEVYSHLIIVSLCAFYCFCKMHTLCIKCKMHTLCAKFKMHTLCALLVCNNWNQSKCLYSTSLMELINCFFLFFFSFFFLL